MVEWSNFFSSTAISPSSSSSAVSSFTSNKLFLRFSFFQNVKNAIRVSSTASTQSLISEVIFSDCYSDTLCGVLNYDLESGSSVIHKVCGYNCYSMTGRAFGYCISKVVNSLNFSTFHLCPSTQYNDKPFGSITLSRGYQVANNINASKNSGSSEGCIIFDHQSDKSKILFVLCIDSHVPGSKAFFYRV